MARGVALMSADDMGKFLPSIGNEQRDDPPRKLMTVPDVRRMRDYGDRPIQWTVHNAFPQAALIVLSSDSGVGKTTLMSAICSAVDRGEAFAGLPTAQRPVLMCDRENPLPITRERFLRLEIDDSPTFRVWGGWCEEEPPGPNSVVLLEWVNACDIKPLLVFDSLVAYHRGDENNASEMRATMQHFRRLADLGATVVVLHHSGKADSAKDFRGSSDIKAAIDVGYHLSSLSGDGGKLGKLRLRPFKARIPVAELALSYVNGRFEIDGGGTMLTTSEIMIQILVDNPRRMAAEFENDAVAKGVPRSRARDFLLSAIQAGTVRIEKGPHNSRFHVWVGEQEEAF